MKTKSVGILISLLLIVGSCTGKRNGNLTIEKKNSLDEYVRSAMEIHHIPGLAVAVVKDGNVIYENYLGNATLEEESPVDDKTIFRVFSTTKLITATGIFQLVEKGKISLEDKISKHFDSLPEAWEQVRVKHLLTHSSGLPDLRYPRHLSNAEVMQELFNDKMDFQTGNQFRYNQTNYWLLARIIEKTTGLSFDAYVLKNQFAASKEGVLFSSDSREEIHNRATRYYYDASKNEFRKDTINVGKRGRPGNGLNISLNEFVAWNRRLNNGELIREKTKLQMWAPFQFANGEDEFLHGWGSYTFSGKTSYGFTGGNLSAFRKFVADDLTIIVLSNGYKHPGYDIIVNDLSKLIFQMEGDTDLLLEQQVMKLVLEKKYADAKTRYAQIRLQDPSYDFDNLRWNINSIGNTFLRSDDIEEACSVYQLNAEVNSKWWVALASYAEGLEKKGDVARALQFYEKAIQLNTDNAYNYNPFMTDKIDQLKK
ncbi:serine hydrolase domain-containing protein [Maribacter sp.]